MLLVYPNATHAASAVTTSKLLPHTPPHCPKKYNSNMPSERYGPSTNLIPPSDWKAGVAANNVNII